MPATTQEWFSGKYGSAVQVPQSDFDKLRASLSKRRLSNPRSTPYDRSLNATAYYGQGTPEWLAARLGRVTMSELKSCW
ncbi:hypothetical protein [Halomonas sp. PA16-9]|uniref:hypothetical protein n=1 Tax=Halomonas sp. PA16-9 TaxID=2576841 RepID=UPI0030EF30E0